MHDKTSLPKTKCYISHSLQLQQVLGCLLKVRVVYFTAKFKLLFDLKTSECSTWNYNKVNTSAWCQTLLQSTGIFFSCLIKTWIVAHYARVVHKLVQITIPDILYCIWTLVSSPIHVGLFQEVQQHAEINWQRIGNVKASPMQCQ